MTGLVLAGYASRFGQRDRGGDCVQKGAFTASLAALTARGERVKMLWQHDPARPIGVWEEVKEDDTGLFVRGRVLDAEIEPLIAGAALDGLSIGYQVKRAQKDQGGGRRLLELDLWEVSLVTFPMLPSARLDGKSAALVQEIRAARGQLDAWARRGKA